MTSADPKLARALRALACAGALTLPLAGCESTTTVWGAEISAYVAQVSINGITAELMQGTPPAPGAGPTVDAPAFADVITGGSARVELGASAAFQTVVIGVDGVNGYYLATLPEMLAQAPMVVTVGSALPSLQFDYTAAVAGADGVFGPYSRTTVEAMQVIGGDIQVSVTWSTTADVDLHVIDPTGEEVFYGNRSAASGGQLDLDANAACTTSDIFQENIGWPRGSAPAGEYIVRVDYWDSCGEPETEFVVTVSVRPGIPVTPVTPGAALRTYIKKFDGPGTHGGAGSGTTITSFIF